MNFFDTQAEQIVIASILLKEEHLLKCKDEINESFFYSKLLRVLYTLIISAYDKHHSIIVPSVLEKLLKKSDVSVEVRRKYAYLIDRFQKKIIADIEFSMSLDAIKENYLKRRLVDTLTYLSQKVETEDANSLYSVLEDAVVDGKMILNNSLILKEGDIKDTTERLLLYDEIRKNPNKFTGIASGFTDLDILTGGIQKSELMIIAGRTGSGKSLMLLNMAYNAWVNGQNIVYFTLEMPKIQIERRFDSRLTATTFLKVKTQQITEIEAEALKNKIQDEVNKRTNKFYVVDIPRGASPMLLESKIKQLQKKFKIDLIAIDYLSLMTPNSSKKSELWEKVFTLANDVKFGIARNFQIPVITAAQISGQGMNKKYGEEYDESDLALAKRMADPCDIILGLRFDKITKQAKMNVIKYRDGLLETPIYLYADLDICLFANLKDEFKGNPTVDLEKVEDADIEKKD